MYLLAPVYNDGSIWITAYTYELFDAVTPLRLHLEIQFLTQLLK